MLILAVVTLFATSVFITTISYRLINPPQDDINVLSNIQKQSIIMDVEIGNKTGINTDRDALHFGIVKPGNSVRRSVNITNNNNYPVEMTFWIEGEMNNWSYVTKPELNLKPNESFMQFVIVQASANTPLGNYTGKLIVQSSPITEFE